MATVSEKIRVKVRERANFLCEYCKRSEEIAGDIFEIDHIQPVSAGGTSEEENLCLACSRCNGSKSNSQTGFDPETNSEVAVFNPRTQNWSEHFRFSDDFSKIQGLTSTGRATVNRLKMNLDFIVRARKNWRKIGWHPLHEE